MDMSVPVVSPVEIPRSTVSWYCTCHHQSWLLGIKNGACKGFPNAVKGLESKGTLSNVVLWLLVTENPGVGMGGGALSTG